MANDQMKRSDITGTCLRLSIGDIRFALMTGDLGPNLAVPEVVRHFEVPGGETDAAARVAWGDLREPATGDRIFDSGLLWQLYRRDGNYIFRFTSSAFGPLAYKEARFNADFTSGEFSLHRAYFDGGAPAYPLESPLCEIWMVNLLAQGRGIEVHASGVRDANGRGYLFLGNCGAGKSTMARLWQRGGGAQIVSEDRIILRFLDGRLWMYPTPWHGEVELTAPVRTGVNEIFFLARGGRNTTRALSPAEAVSGLLARSFAPLYNAPGLDFTLSFLERAAQQVPCRELAFVPDERVVDFVRQGERSYA
jgi:hypothetical protein